MKKITTLLLFTLLYLFSFSQRETRTLAMGTVQGAYGASNWKFLKEINGSSSSTSFYWGFQNEKYQHITDIGSIFFSRKFQLIEFINILKILSSKEKGSNIEYNIGKLEIKIYEFSNRIYISDDGKYITISKKAAIKAAEEINQNIDLL